MSWRDYQALQEVVRLGDRFMSYVDRGRGEPVVLLHGIPTWGWLWHDILGPLSALRRVLVPDLLGFGFSDKRDVFDRSIAAQADAIVALLDALGLERAAIVGHDVGGGVALRLACLHPGRVERVAVLNSVCYDSWPVLAMTQLGYPEAERRLSPRTLRSLLSTALRAGFAQRPRAGVIDALLAPYATDVGARSLVRCASALNTNLTTELAPRLRALEAPLLALWGEDDAFQPVRYAERLVWDVPDGRLVRLRDARHFVPLDRPGAVIDALGTFLGAGRALARTS